MTDGSGRVNNTTLPTTCTAPLDRPWRSRTLASVLTSSISATGGCRSTHRPRSPRTSCRQPGSIRRHDRITRSHWRIRHRLPGDQLRPRRCHRRSRQSYRPSTRQHGNRRRRRAVEPVHCVGGSVHLNGIPTLVQQPFAKAETSCASSVHGVGLSDPSCIIHRFRSVHEQPIADPFLRVFARQRSGGEHDAVTLELVGAIRTAVLTRHGAGWEIWAAEVA